ncbi:hypothetical protein Ctob_009561, partial [Chrysochromulina tobinii]
MVDAAAESDDEVVDASNLEGLAGARVRVERSGSHCLGTVRSVSPGGSRMLVCCDADATEVWVGAEDAWDLDVSTPAAEQPAASAATADAVASQAAALERAPILENWKWTADGALCGHVYGKPGFREGELMTTSTVPPEGRFETHVVTESGNVYRLGMAAEAAPVGAGAISEAGSGGGGTAGGGMRRSSRATGKESVLDAFADSRHPVGEPQQQLSYQVGGADVGGAGADRIMRGAFETLDDNMVGLRTQYAAARRVVLYRDETPVAAAVVEVHPEQGVLEVPLLAAERHCRQQGHGTVLVAILIELGCRLRLAMLIASATHESTRFWLRQGLHTFSHCSPPVRAELRKIDQSARRGFA